ncbi:MAG: aldo/keto reductase [Pseudomonadota bacterium]
MQMRVLGRTGLSVGIAGLGCGGHSRLGQTQGATSAQSVGLVRTALDSGVTLLDTAAAYGTEEIVGEAIRGRRDQVVISTKIGVYRDATENGPYLSAAAFIARTEDNLRRLGTDYIDILHLHGVAPEHYDYCRAALIPALQRLQAAGKIRFLGITERFVHDTAHRMLQDALRDDVWDVMMVGFSLINPSARRIVFPVTRAKNIGVLAMFAVRRALSCPGAAAALVRDLIAQGRLAPDGIAPDDPLSFLAEPDVAGSVVEAAYRFCIHEPGVDLVLTGTGSVSHLRQNLASIGKPPLPAKVLKRLAAMFGHIDSISGN